MLPAHNPLSHYSAGGAAAYPGGGHGGGHGAPGRLPTVFFEQAGKELAQLPGARVLNPRGLVRDVAINMIPATVMVRWAAA